MVTARIEGKLSPCHVLLKDVQKKASIEISNYNKEQFLSELRELIRSRKLYSGKTANGIWISHRKNNVIF